jgi:hypothetical protein
LPRDLRRSIDGITSSNPNATVNVSFECYVFSGRGPCVGLITCVVCLSVIVVTVRLSLNFIMGVKMYTLDSEDRVS